MYDPVEFLTSTSRLRWNDGSAIDLRSPGAQVALRGVVDRAVRASRGKPSTVHAEPHSRAMPRPPCAMCSPQRSRRRLAPRVRAAGALLQHAAQLVRVRRVARGGGQSLTGRVRSAIDCPV